MFELTALFVLSGVTWQSRQSSVPVMPAKKDSGPPPKPKPEELIDEFKEKFEKYSLETREQNDELEQKIVSVKDSLLNLEHINENNHSQSQIKIKQLFEDINENIEHKFKDVSIEIKDRFQNLEKQLSDGRMSPMAKIPICRLCHFQAPTTQGIVVLSSTCWSVSWRRPGTSWSSSRTRREAT